MKQSTLITICLVVLMVFGWMSGFMSIGNKNEKENEYETYLADAREYLGRGLYQKAAQEYEKAISLNNTEELWTDMIDAYEACYEENKSVYDDYETELKSAISQYSKNAEFQCKLTQLYISKGEYEDAYKTVKKAVENGIDNDELNRLYLETKYAYDIDWNAYQAYRGLSEGYYAVDHNGIWEYLAEDGAEDDFGNLKLAGSVGENGIRLIVLQIPKEDSDKTNIDLMQEITYTTQSELIDTNGVVQGLLDFEPQDAGVYAEGLIAIKNGDAYAYYDALGDKQFGSYVQAGTFQNGMAAVQDEKSWYLIDKAGNRVSEETYEEIKLNPDGTYSKNDVMIAKKDGMYRIYKKDIEVGSYSDIDIMTDDNGIAVCKNGQWGFVNSDGEEIIAPVYVEAKSFSNGLAAVSNGETWGFIDKDGTLVIDYTFLNADYFNSKGNCMIEESLDNWKFLTLYNTK